MVRGALDRVHELHRRYALEQVADCTGVQHLHDSRLVAVLRHREDPCLRRDIPELPRDARTSVVRQPRAHHRHLGLVQLPELDGRQCVLRHADELERRRPVDRRAERVPEHGIIVD